MGYRLYGENIDAGFKGKFGIAICNKQTPAPKVKNPDKRAGSHDYIKEQVMESIFACMRKVILVIFLSIVFLMPLGCSMEQLGESAAEGNRRHMRILRLYKPEMVTDLDQMLFLDQPNRLTEKRIP